MQQEILPNRFSMRNPHTRMENQGSENTCLTFGFSSSLEAMRQRLGINAQLSPRWIWYWANKYSLNVENILKTINSMGIASDLAWPYMVEEEYPFKVSGLDDPPNSVAYDSVRTTFPALANIEMKRVFGKYRIMRELCRGSSLVLIKNGITMEHCVAGIGYDIDLGVEIHDSGNNIYYQPWEDFDTNVIQQVWFYSKLPFAKVPADNYIPQSIPSFTKGVLELPLLRVFTKWGEPSVLYKNVIVHFLEGNSGLPETDDYNVDQDDPEALWKSERKILTIPELLYEGTYVKQVVVTDPKVQIISYQT